MSGAARSALDSPFGLVADLGAAVAAQLGLQDAQIAAWLGYCAGGTLVGTDQARAAVVRGRREIASRRLNRQTPARPGPTPVSARVPPVVRKARTATTAPVVRIAETAPTAPEPAPAPMSAPVPAAPVPDRASKEAADRAAIARAIAAACAAPAAARTG